MIANVTASDEDHTDRIYYSLLGDDTAMEFFYVNAMTGEVSLKSVILHDVNSRYQVSLQGSYTSSYSLTSSYTSSYSLTSSYTSSY